MELEKEIHQVKPFRNEYHKAAVNLIFTGKWILQFHSDVFKKYKLTLQQYNILRILRGRYPAPVKVKLIRERMLDRMSDASRIIEVLRKKGLLERSIRETDRRSMDVVITISGIKLLEKMDEKENEKMDEYLTTLDKKEIEKLNFLLDKLRR